MDRKLVTKSDRPNIINVKVEDKNNIITCMQISDKGNLLLAGTSTGHILQFQLNTMPVKKGNEMGLDGNNNISLDDEIPEVKNQN